MYIVRENQDFRMDALAVKNTSFFCLKNIIQQAAWLAILGAVAGCAAAGWFCRYILPQVYQASAWMVVWREDGAAARIPAAGKITGLPLNKRNFMLPPLDVGGENINIKDFQSLLLNDEFISILYSRIGSRISGYEKQNITLSAVPLESSCLVEISARGPDPIKTLLFLNTALEVLSGNSLQLFNIHCIRLPAKDKTPHAALVNNFRRTVLVMGGGTLLGMLLGTVAAWLLWYCGANNCSVGEFAAQLDTPLLAVLPDCVSHGGVDSGSIQSVNAYADVINSLKEHIEQLFPSAVRGKVLLIAGVSSRSGVEKLIADLACSLSWEQKKVLLVDLDWRRNASRSFFDQANSSGVLDLLSRSTEFERLVIRRVDGMSLDLLPCGSCDAENASGRYNSRVMENFLNDMADKYDYILLAPSPIQGAAESMILAKLADQTLLAGKVCFRTVAEAKLVLWRLRKAQAQVGGFVAISVPMQSLNELYDSNLDGFYQYSINRS